MAIARGASYNKRLLYKSTRSSYGWHIMLRLSTNSNQRATAHNSISRLVMLLPHQDFHEASNIIMYSQICQESVDRQPRGESSFPCISINACQAISVEDPCAASAATGQTDWRSARCCMPSAAAAAQGTGQMPGTVGHLSTHRCKQLQHCHQQHIDAMECRNWIPPLSSASMVLTSQCVLCSHHLFAIGLFGQRL